MKYFVLVQDDIVEKFLQTGEMESPSIQLKKRLIDLIPHVVWALITLPPVFYYIGYSLMYGSFFRQCTVVVGFVIGKFLLLFTWNKTVVLTLTKNYHERTY